MTDWLKSMNTMWDINLCSAEHKLAGMQPMPSMKAQSQPVTGLQMPQQQMPNVRRPSAVAPLARAKGNPASANVMDMFNPQQQQTKGPTIAPPMQSMGGAMPKLAAVHAMGDPLPKDWNKKLVPPTKENGGIPTYGREAWESMNHKRRKSSDKNNFDKSWHTELGKRAYAAGATPKLKARPVSRPVSVNRQVPKPVATPQQAPTPMQPGFHQAPMSNMQVPSMQPMTPTPQQQPAMSPMSQMPQQPARLPNQPVRPPNRARQVPMRTPATTPQARPTPQPNPQQRKPAPGYRLPPNPVPPRRTTRGMPAAQQPAPQATPTPLPQIEQEVPQTPTPPTSNGPLPQGMAPVRGVGRAIGKGMDSVVGQPVQPIMTGLRSILPNALRAR